MTCYLTQNEKRLRRERKLRRCASLTLCLGAAVWILFLLRPRASNSPPAGTGTPCSCQVGPAAPDFNNDQLIGTIYNVLFVSLLLSPRSCR